MYKGHNLYLIKINTNMNIKLKLVDISLIINNNLKNIIQDKIFS